MKEYLETRPGMAATKCDSTNATEFGIMEPEHKRRSTGIRTATQRNVVISMDRPAVSRSRSSIR